MDNLPLGPVVSAPQFAELAAGPSSGPAAQFAELAAGPSSGPSFVELTQGSAGPAAPTVQAVQLPQNPTGRLAPSSVGLTAPAQAIQFVLQAPTQMVPASSSYGNTLTQYVPFHPQQFAGFSGSAQVFHNPSQLQYAHQAAAAQMPFLPGIPFQPVQATQMYNGYGSQALNNWSNHNPAPSAPIDPSPQSAAAGPINIYAGGGSATANADAAQLQTTELAAQQTSELATPAAETPKNPWWKGPATFIAGVAVSIGTGMAVSFLGKSKPKPYKSATVRTVKTPFGAITTTETTSETGTKADLFNF